MLPPGSPGAAARAGLGSGTGCRPLNLHRNCDCELTCVLRIVHGVISVTWG